MSRLSLSQESGVAFAQNNWSSSSRCGGSSPDAFSFQEHRKLVVPLQASYQKQTVTCQWAGKIPASTKDFHMFSHPSTQLCRRKISRQQSTTRANSTYWYSSSIPHRWRQCLLLCVVVSVQIPLTTAPSGVDRWWRADTTNERGLLRHLQNTGHFVPLAPTHPARCRRIGGILQKHSHQATGTTTSDSTRHDFSWVLTQIRAVNPLAWVQSGTVNLWRLHDPDCAHVGGSRGWPDEERGKKIKN